MSQLSTNTTDLQAILAQVNALPEAGGGSGANDFKIVTGTFTTANTFTALEVTGVGFKPKCVFVAMDGNTITQNSSSSSYHLHTVYWYDDGNVHYDRVLARRGTGTGTNVTTYPAETYGFSVTDDGFQLGTPGQSLGTTYRVMNGSFRYFAMTW